ncbi:MAG: hypothetical protein DRP66_11855 [Planctomycetota bacterium]|nr:MAG: hypothetical protein DRP66_11855 [Planctomycetota bacterium]
MNRNNRKKPPLRIGLRVLCIAIIILAVVCVVGVYLLTHVPGEYQPLQPPPTDEVSPYLTHYLAPNFHNNIQLDEPFDVVVAQKGLNEIIVDENSLGWGWPYSLNGVVISAPSVVFQKDTIILMGTVDYAGFPIVITVIGTPALNENGLLSLNIRKVKAGAVNITPLAGFIARQVVAHQLRIFPRTQWLRDLDGALADNKSFDPVFPIYNSEKHIRLTKAEIANGKLILGFAPAN